MALKGAVGRAGTAAAAVCSPRAWWLHLSTLNRAVYALVRVSHRFAHGLLETAACALQ